jgi:hypothetical protein
MVPSKKRAPGYLFEVLLFTTIPIVLEAQSASTGYLIAAGLTTIGYGILGWHLQPLLLRQSHGLIMMWLVPPGLMAVGGLLASSILALGPALVYVTVTCARGQNVSVRDLVPSTRNEYILLTLTIALVALILISIVYCSVICQWIVLRLMQR